MVRLVDLFVKSRVKTVNKENEMIRGLIGTALTVVVIVVVLRFMGVL